MNRKIVIIAEGDTERAAGDHLKRFLDGRASNLPKVRIQVLTIQGLLTKEAVRRHCEEHLANPQTVGLIALTDLYPQFDNADQARAMIRSWMPRDSRCHAHVAKHDFEAWLLTDWDGILSHAGIRNKKPWGSRPEDINHQSPPARRIKDLFFNEAKPCKRYKKPIDGKKLFERLDLAEVARQCPEFKSFVNCLLCLAGYPDLG